VPLYEDLVRRAIEAQERAESLVRDSHRIHNLAQLLRDADAGNVMLVRCAWCDSFRVGEEWLRLEAIGHGQLRITAAVRARASHGICEECLASQLRRRDE
jgi:hypothetical protein